MTEEIENTQKKTVRIDENAKDLLEEWSIKRYGSSRNMSVIATTAVKFFLDPTAEQIALRNWWADDADLGKHYYDDDDEGSKVFHWTAPYDLVDKFESDVTGSAGSDLSHYIKQYIYILDKAQGTFANPAKEDNIEWDAIKGNYQLEFDPAEEIENDSVPKSPSYRLPLALASMRNRNPSMYDVDNYTKIIGSMFYDDVAGADVSEKRRRQDFDELVEKGYLIANPQAQGNDDIMLDVSNPNYSDDVDIGAKYCVSWDMDTLEQQIEATLETVDRRINYKIDQGETLSETSQVWRTYVATLQAVMDYDRPEFREYAKRAEELKKEMTKLSPAMQ